MKILKMLDQSRLMGDFKVISTKSDIVRRKKKMFRVILISRCRINIINERNKGEVRKFFPFIPVLI